MGHPEVPDDAPRPNSAEGVTITRTDLVFLRRAVGEGWAIPDCVRNEALYAIAAILGAPTGKNSRLKLSAIRALAALDRVDLARERVHGSTSDTSSDTKALRELLLTDESDAAPEGAGPGPGLGSDPAGTAGV